MRRRSRPATGATNPCSNVRLKWVLAIRAGSARRASSSDGRRQRGIARSPSSTAGAGTRSAAAGSAPRPASAARTSAVSVASVSRRRLPNSAKDMTTVTAAAVVTAVAKTRPNGERSAPPRTGRSQADVSVPPTRSPPLPRDEPSPPSPPGPLPPPLPPLPAPPAAPRTPPAVSGSADDVGKGLATPGSPGVALALPDGAAGGNVGWPPSGPPVTAGFAVGRGVGAGLTAGVGCVVGVARGEAVGAGVGRGVAVGRGVGRGVGLGVTVGRGVGVGRGSTIVTLPAANAVVNLPVSASKLTGHVPAGSTNEPAYRTPFLIVPPPVRASPLGAPATRTRTQTASVPSGFLYVTANAIGTPTGADRGDTVGSDSRVGPSWASTGAASARTSMAAPNIAVAPA